MSDTDSLTRLPALRAPARWPQVIRAEMGVQTSGLSGGWLGLLFLLTPMMAGAAEQEAFGELRVLATLMFFLPLAQWDGLRARREAPMPMDQTRLELVRVVCGAVYAAGIFGVCVCLYAGALTRFIDSGWTLAGHYPTWYPLALFIAGMAHYLLGAAATLRVENPGRVLIVVFALGWMALSLLGIGLETTEHSVDWNEDYTTKTWTFSTSLTIGSALLRLAIGCSAITLAVVAGRVGGGLGWNLRNPLRSRVLARRAATPPALLRSPRTPASLPAIAMRQFVVLAPRMAWTFLFTAYFAWRLWNAETTAPGGVPVFINKTSTFGVLYVAASLWPVLVWSDEHPESPWDAARPAGAVAWRLLHAAAGMVWLLIAALLLMAASVWGAISAGTLGSPAELPVHLWLGLPIATLATYCVATAMFMLSDRSALAAILGALWVLPVTFLATAILFGDLLSSQPAPLSPIRVLAPIGWAQGEDWSFLPVILWTPLCLAAAVGAICLDVWQERRGGYLDRHTIVKLAWSSWRRRRAVPAP